MIYIPRVSKPEQFEYPNLEDYPNKMVNKVVEQSFLDEYNHQDQENAEEGKYNN
jgi:hypothetical protein